MTHLLVQLYNFFQRKKLLFYLSLLAVVATLSYFALQVRLQEDISRFLPNIDESGNISRVFKHMKATDKLMLVFSTNGTLDKDKMVEACDRFADELKTEDKDSLIKETFTGVNDGLVEGMSDYVYNNLPILLNRDDYQRIDSLLQPNVIAARVKVGYNNLLSPASVALSRYIGKDPLGIGYEKLVLLKELQLNADYELYNGHIFSKNGKNLVAIITPANAAGNTRENEKLIKHIEQKAAAFEEEYSGLHIGYFGGPAISVSNARQIKSDTILTSIIALLVIVIFISFAFKRKSAIPLIIVPVVFGALFALALISVGKGEISAIAIGAGAAVLGIALSYSIHVMVHATHTESIAQLIKEIAQPLTIGSFTTIGAFAGLVFTKSEILQDFGLFSAYTLIGTTLFCLIFMPHFLHPSKHEKQSKLNRFIEKLNGYAFEKNRWLVAVIFVMAVVGFFASQKVTFEPSLDNMYYKDPKLFATADSLNSVMGGEMKTVYFVSVADSYDDAYQAYQRTSHKLQDLQKSGKVAGYSTASGFLIPPQLQQERIVAWNQYWTADRKEKTLAIIRSEAEKLGFSPHAFAPFEQLLNIDYKPIATDEQLKLFPEWLNMGSGAYMLLNQVQLKVSNRDEVYVSFADSKDVVVFDPGYYTKQMISFLNNDFNLVLLISSLLVFTALLISYGRLELALMAFLPMAIGWLIILGLFGLFGIKFNIISIIISTFIFGIGDDFSIFVMDGLQVEYERGKKMLLSHKTAIFYSAFTILVGVGVLVLAKHPALFSIAISSFIGLASVILVVYTILPLAYRFFISNRAKKGLYPRTILDILSTFYSLSIFVIGSLALTLLSYILPLIPARKKKKQYFFRCVLMYSMRFVLYSAFGLKKNFVSLTEKPFNKPSVVVANHQSVIDILVMFALSPKAIMLTNRWVWNSPIFGRVVRYAGCYCVENGYENAIDIARECANNGYSVIIFPEGTRSTDGHIKRFHKGAFYLAEQLQLPIVPVVLHGNNQAITKGDIFCVKRATLTRKIYDPIIPNDATRQDGYKEFSKYLTRWYRQEYTQLCEEIDTTENVGFRQRLIRSYTYKGPVLEWYLRVKARMEKYYKPFDELIPRNASICDIGCGYGFMAYMLSFVSKERSFTCVDYDEDKIEVANHCFSKSDNMQFDVADATQYQPANHDVFVLNDVLHYFPKEEQTKLLMRCAAMLNNNGMIIIRDGDSMKSDKHKWTRWSEIFSTRIFHFNKKQGELHFLSAKDIATFASQTGLSIQTTANDTLTSNTIFILRKNG